jgi:hypothetical protein
MVEITIPSIVEQDGASYRASTRCYKKGDGNERQA